MVPSSTDDWPTDPDGLVTILLDPAQGQEMRNRALRDLSPIVHRVARRVAGRFAGAYADDVPDDALADVWQALPGYQQGHSFEAWCYGVLRNKLLSRLRASAREQRHLAELRNASPEHDLQRALERLLDEQRPFLSDSDLAALRTWPLAPRLMLLCLSGLWEKVPSDEWAAWGAEYGNQRGTLLPAPFPPDEIRESEEIAGRNAVLARAMGVVPNTLSVWLYRYKGRLRQLLYVRILLNSNE